MQQGLCLRIYLSESDRIDGASAMEAVLKLCREHGLRGVTVWRGAEGMGSHGVHTTSLLSLASGLPLLVEAIDTESRIRDAVEAIRPHLAGRLMATWPVRVSRLPEE